MSYGKYENYEYRANDKVYCSCYGNVINYVPSIRPVLFTFTRAIGKLFLLYIGPTRYGRIAIYEGDRPMTTSTAAVMGMFVWPGG